MRAIRFIALLVLLLVLGACSDNGGDRDVKPNGDDGADVVAPAQPYEPTAADVAEHNRGVGLMGRFAYDQAHDVFAKLFAEHPNWLAVKVDLAIATLNRQRAGDGETALRLLREVAEAEPANLRARYCTGILQYYRGDFDAALEHFAAVAEADPADAFAAYFVGQCHFEKGDHELALRWYEKAMQLDGYLRSAVYGANQVNRLLGRTERADELLAIYQRLDKAPQAKLAEIKYTRMGPKAEVRAIDLNAGDAGAPPVAPEGLLFAEPVPLPLVNGDGLTWAKYEGAGEDDAGGNAGGNSVGTVGTVGTGGTGGRPPSITACDIDGDGRLDLFITGALVVEGARRNAVLLQRKGEKFEAMLDHPLATVGDVNAALWGDYDNDGFTDVYLLRRGANMQWRQTAKNEWQDVTAATQTAGDALDSVDGAIFDADHDGDLDVFVVNRDGPNELFNNNLDGTFRPIAQERGIAGNGKPSRQVVVADFDSDRDADIIVFNEQPPNEMYLNDRLWRYTAFEGDVPFLDLNVVSAAAADMDADGFVEIATLSETSKESGSLTVFGYERQGRAGPLTWVARPDATLAFPPRTHRVARLTVADVEGDATFDLVWSVSDQPWVAGSRQDGWEGVAEVRGLKAWALVTFGAARGPSAIAIESGKPPLLVPPGPGRHPFAALSFTGKESDADQMRSNRSGIGVVGAARIGTRWSAFDTYRNSGGPGQSLQPIAIGLGGAKAIDFVSMTWPDGVFQTEVQLKAGEHHVIEETQRQLASCPLVFAWDGEKFAFVSDILGVGGIGFNVGNGEYGEPRPRESLLMPAGLLRPRDGRFVIKIGEPMEETCYLDSGRLIAWDLPPGWAMTLDERFAIEGPAVTGAARFYRRSVLPSRAVNERGEDVTERVQRADHRAATVGEVDRRFIGRLRDEHVLTLTFEEPLQDLLAKSAAHSEHERRAPSASGPPPSQGGAGGGSSAEVNLRNQTTPMTSTQSRARQEADKSELHRAAQPAPLRSGLVSEVGWYADDMGATGGLPASARASQTSIDDPTTTASAIAPSDDPATNSDAESFKDSRTAKALADEPPVAPKRPRQPLPDGRGSVLTINERPQLLLLIDGWIEYPYSQTMFAAWQAGAEYRAPSLEARGADGEWVTIYEQWGFPAGMPRQMSLPIPLDKLPAGCTQLRIATNDEVYFDRIAVALAEPCPDARRIELPLSAASVAEVGFAKRTTGPQRLPHYDYQHRAPLWDARHAAGWYTAFGPALPVVARTDDAVAIIGPGEEVHLEFDAAPLGDAPQGWSRRFILTTTGWCKDMDLYTRDGETVAPLPHRPDSDAATLQQRDTLHRAFNTRYRSGY